MIEGNIYSSTRHSRGHTWTIVSHLSEMLIDIEKKYGDRDSEYTILGIELTDRGGPSYWLLNDCKHVIIQITENCLTNMDGALFQLAHEAIHLLNPLECGTVNYLEEGLATYYSLSYPNSSYVCDDAKYQLASDLVRELLAYDDNIIKKLRGSELKSLSSIRKEDILKIHPTINDELITKLTTNFQIDLI